MWNHNGTRQLQFVEVQKKPTDGRVNFFTCSNVGFDVNGKEFIALGTSNGEIHYIDINGTNFTKEVGFVMSDESSITAISGDPRSKTLAVANSNGFIIIFSCDN